MLRLGRHRHRRLEGVTRRRRRQQVLEKKKKKSRQLK